MLEAAAERSIPKCRHYGKCGGCHYQHMAYGDQLSAKSQILRDQLGRIGHIEEANVGATVGSAKAWNYRNQIQFHLTAEGRLGFMRAGRGANEDILPIQECHLPEENINALWPQLEMDSEAGVERVVARAGSDGEPMLVFRARSPEPPELEVEAAISVVHVYDDNAVVQAGEDHIRLRVLDRDFRVSPTSFFQVNLDVAGKMLEHVLALLPSTIDTMVDAYCGVGLFSAFLAPRCRRLIGIESSAPACEDFVANLDEYENVELYEDVVERVLPALDIRPDVILMDPPRAGLSKTVVSEVVRLAPASIVYVSCDPPTLGEGLRPVREGGLHAGGRNAVRHVPADVPHRERERPAQDRGG